MPSANDSYRRVKRDRRQFWSQTIGPEAYPITSSGLPSCLADCLVISISLVRSAADAKTLILALPNCDRGRAAVALYGQRDRFEPAVVYASMIAAWDHDHRVVIDAFGSRERLVAALKEVSPDFDPESATQIEVWRGAVVNRDDTLLHTVGLCWSRSRNVACWFSLRDYVPALQPSLAPVVFRAKIDQSAVVARHDSRAEQEVIVDVGRLLRAGYAVTLDGIDGRPLNERDRIDDLCPDRDAFDRVLDDWRRAGARYGHAAIISSITTISGCTAVEMANARRTNMPVEYVRSGISRYTPSSENSPTEGASALASANVKPKNTQRKMIFCHPVASGSMPSPMSVKEETLPSTTASPATGG
jgi:hypothetical protein